jgi:hypothetical protein
MENLNGCERIKLVKIAQNLKAKEIIINVNEIARLSIFTPTLSVWRKPLKSFEI